MITARLKKLAGGILVYSALVLMLLGFRPAAAQDGGTGPEFYRCYLDKIELAADCLDLTVPENWDNPEGRQIDLHLAIVRAKGGFSEPDPFLVFAGGPGQAATDYAPFVKAAFSKINERRDIILVDQRGTGNSTPLECKGTLALLGYIPDHVLTQGLKSCLDGYDVDVRYFTSFDILKDIEHVRNVLEVDQFNIWGGSFGTRLGLLYMKLYPDSVRSAILDGVTAPTTSLYAKAGITAEKAWQKLVMACENDPACRDAYPNLDARFRALLEKLRNTPVEEITKNPIDGQQLPATYNDIWLAEIVRSALYQPSRTSILPLAITKAEAGDFSVLNALGLDSAAWAGNTMAIGSTLSILCAEDIPTISPDEAAAAGEGSFHADFYYRMWKAACAGWPVRDVLDGYNDPINSVIPTLILSGGLDPVTPPLNGNEAEQYLQNVLHLTAANAGHNVTPFGCAPGIMADFVTAASIEGLDGTCLNEPTRPPFAVTPLGPNS